MIVVVAPLTLVPSYILLYPLSHQLGLYLVITWPSLSQTPSPCPLTFPHSYLSLMFFISLYVFFFRKFAVVSSVLSRLSSAGISRARRLPSLTLQLSCWPPPPDFVRQRFKLILCFSYGISSFSSHDRLVSPHCHCSAMTAISDHYTVRTCPHHPQPRPCLYPSALPCRSTHISPSLPMPIYS